MPVGGLGRHVHAGGLGRCGGRLHVGGHVVPPGLGACAVRPGRAVVPRRPGARGLLAAGGGARVGALLRRRPRAGRRGARADADLRGGAGGLGLGGGGLGGGGAVGAGARAPRGAGAARGARRGGGLGGDGGLRGPGLRALPKTRRPVIGSGAAGRARRSCGVQAQQRASGHALLVPRYLPGAVLRLRSRLPVRLHAVAHRQRRATRPQSAQGA
mmetsp:Transcript_112250/g.362470  ORF Transcript_112250/g.362470 Transcript_112250/m.362470 type:complete len:214 (+) Transcript_112250:1645-2286(+)